MYLYMGLLAVIPGIIYFTFFINRLLRTILNIHTNWFLIIMISDNGAINSSDEHVGVIWGYLLSFIGCHVVV